MGQQQRHRVGSRLQKLVEHPRPSVGTAVEPLRQLSEGADIRKLDGDGTADLAKSGTDDGIVVVFEEVAARPVVQDPVAAKPGIRRMVSLTWFAAISRVHSNCRGVLAWRGHHRKSLWSNRMFMSFQQLLQAW